jgi:hypothetical protein
MQGGNRFLQAGNFEFFSNAAEAATANPLDTVKNFNRSL